MMELDPILLSRIQFAFTVSFHILFPAFTIGLASFLALVSGLWLVTGDPRYRCLYRFWVKLFAVSFGLGVVSGIVMSYAFGTNWSRFSDATGNVLGPLLSYEVLTAFFLEATFLGIMLFGQNRVPRWVHFFATCMVALGTLISAFWILSANSWMHTPAGATLKDGIFYAEDWWAIVFNPSFPYRFAHMVLAAYLTTCFVIGAVAAGYLLKGRFTSQARLMMAMSVVFAGLVVPLQIVAGDLQGLNVRDHQPAKLAAMEGVWETGGYKPWLLFAWPDMAAETNHLEIGIPAAASLIITHDPGGVITGLKDFPADERPPVAIVFWSFRLMLAIGMLMLVAGLWGIVLLIRGRLYETRWFLHVWRLMLPSGFLAVLSGWTATEVGRQPWLVQGLMRTSEGVSPVAAEAVGVSLLLFFLAYLTVFSAGVVYMARIVRHGPDIPDDERPMDGTAKRPLSAAPDLADARSDDAYQGAE